MGDFGWRLQKEMNRKAKTAGGSLISTAQVRAVPSKLKSAAEQSTDAPTTIVTQIRQFYQLHTSPCDGEKFLRIQFYERKRNYEIAKRWKRLLGAKLKSFNQISRNEWLSNCLERLEPFRSLWMSFQLGSFPLILSWRCRQEIECYLTQVYDIWHTIIGGDAHLCDEYTIQKLGGLAPLWSSRNRSMIEDMFARHQVFPRVHDLSVRAQICQRVLAVDGLILNFQTFFKHVKILGPVMIPLRELLPPGQLNPARDEFRLVSRSLPSARDVLIQNCYERSGQEKQQCLLQLSEHDVRFMECSDPALYSYWQLCLHLLRHVQEHRNYRTGFRDQAQSPERPGWVIRLGKLARRLGFESDMISSLCNQDPDLSQIRMHMLQERPNIFFSAPTDKFHVEAHSRQRSQVIFEPRPPAPTPLMTTDSATTKRVPRNHPELFLPTIWSALTQERRYALTEYGELVLILMSFFEKFGSSSVSSTQRGSHPAQQLIRSSSVYSVPVYPDDPLRPQGANITFWHLPQSRDMSLLAAYRCDATREGIKRVVNSIRAQSVAPLFALVDRDGRLKLCDPSQILHRRERSRRPEDVYYIYRHENCRIWIMKPM